MSAAGFLLVDKPVGLTSHDVVARVRRAARSKRVGHAGTLDPFATGLLVLAIGEHTRLLPFLEGEPKVYETTVRFGFETDTDDRTGSRTIAGAPPDPTHMHDIALGIQQLTGALQQTPPSYSAKHVAGQRAYALARSGRVVTMSPTAVHVYDWSDVELDGACLHATIACGAGTYVRALARDLGRAIDSAAHAESLRRVRCGAASIADAIALDALSPGSIADGQVVLHSPLPLLANVAVVDIDIVAVRALSFGRPVSTTNGDPSDVPRSSVAEYETVTGAGTGAGAHAALVHDGQVMAMATRRNEQWHPHTVLHEAVTGVLQGAAPVCDP